MHQPPVLELGVGENWAIFRMVKLGPVGLLHHTPAYATTKPEAFGRCATGF